MYSTRWIASTGNKRRVVVVPALLLRGAECPVCQPDSYHREVCCLAGAWVRDITGRLPGLIQHTDYYAIVIVQVGSDKDIRSKVGVSHLRGFF